MASRKKEDEPKIEDEPGAEQRFKGILKRALNMPPPRKQPSGGKDARSAKGKK